jgi:hypothetical protein
MAAAVSLLEATGPGPSPRHGLACAALSTLDSSHLYVFGGIRPHGTVEAGTKYHNDLHALDWSSRVWKQIPSRGEHWPQGRAFHSATAIDSRAFLVFGGATAAAPAASSCPADCTASDAATGNEPGPSKHTRASLQRASQAPDTLAKAEAEAEAPAATDPAFLNDVWLFKSDISEWVPVVCRGAPPSPRAAHAATLVPAPARLLIHGGSGPHNAASKDMCAAGR